MDEIQNQQPQGTPQNEPLDPTVVALTRAIGKSEGGGKLNYSAVGDNGNSFGAYQMTPAFLQEWAPKAGVDYTPGSGNLMSIENQNKIAYTAVKTMGTTGDPNHPELGKLTPAQIASLWNTGDPNIYAEDPSYGSNNAYGGIGGYVDAVKKNYNDLMGNTPQTQKPQEPKKQGGKPFEFTDIMPDVLNFLEKGVENLPNVAGAGLGVIGSHLGIAGAGTAATAAATAFGGPEAGLITDMLTGQNKSTQTNQQPSDTTQTDQTQSQVQIPQALSQSAAASNAVKAAISEMINATQSGRTYAQSQPGQDAINTASAFGLLAPDENGNMVFNSQKAQDVMGKIAGLDDKIIEAEGGTGLPENVLANAAQYVANDKYTTPRDRQQAIENIQKEIEARGVPLGKEMSLSDMRTAQKEHYAVAKGGYKGGKTSAEILAHKALANAYGKVIRANLKNPELHDRVLKMEQGIKNAQELGKKLNGKKIPKKEGGWEWALRQGARAAEIYIGERLGGPIGAIIGGFVGEQFNRKITQKFGANIFETPGMKAALDILHDTEPQMYAQLVDALEKRGMEIQPKEIKGKKGIGPEDVVKEIKGKPSIIEMDKLVNEIKQSRKGLVKR